MTTDNLNHNDDSTRGKAILPMDEDDFEIALKLPYRQALEVVESALRAEGFGVITRIDVQKTMMQNLNVDFRPYTILGACNPPIAHRALERDPRIGLLLPCNVSVEAYSENQVMVRIADPAQLITCSNSDDEVVAEIATETRRKLLKVSARLRGIIHPPDNQSRSWERLNSTGE